MPPCPPPSSLAADEITLGASKAFTLSDDTALTLALLDQIRVQPVSEGQLKSALKPEAIKDSDRRVMFVGQKAYKAAGDRLTAL